MSSYLSAAILFDLDEGFSLPCIRGVVYQFWLSFLKLSDWIVINFYVQWVTANMQDTNELCLYVLDIH